MDGWGVGWLVQLTTRCRKPFIFNQKLHVIPAPVPISFVCCCTGSASRLSGWRVPDTSGLRDLRLRLPGGFQHVTSSRYVR